MLEKHKLLNTFSQNLAIMGTTFYFRIAYKCEISIVFWFFKADYIFHGTKAYMWNDKNSHYEIDKQRTSFLEKQKEEAGSRKTRETS